MKYGYRKPSFSKSISARTTGRLNRSMKKVINPMYGKKGMGYINDPEKAIYNKVYDKTTKKLMDDAVKINIVIYALLFIVIAVVLGGFVKLFLWFCSYI